MPPIPCKERDFLEQDLPVRGQNYACLSFISPTDAIASKNAFATSRFLSAFCSEIREVVEGIEARVTSQEDKNTLANLKDRYAYAFDAGKLKVEYDKYMSSYSDDIARDWASENDHQACVYGIKIRGAYETLDEAQARARTLKRTDPNFSVYVCEMGCWVPWSPNPDDISDAEYTETELNTLMKKYRENMALRDEFYEANKQDMIDKSVALGKDIEAQEIPASEGIVPSTGGPVGAGDLLKSME